ncbi:hypothetical protein EA187_05015 [Lujinxingia sediminis]|uniref:Tetratricopeptide repeat protein n=1 Tax=Lujinxingia sediminis TaxID=2480984 RepID=A0ABY0CYQ3_9DELT|nr:tetratricopeptide repeat protein [Lujinxingia sediminis]RVU48793.1 hypothetical protein EA187_05015 [Lujinxingia sediminis]
MGNPDESDDRASRLGRIQTIVHEDFERIQSTADPYVVLNLAPGSDIDEVRSRYERYERFYRAENFQRLGDMDLTRKALDIRRAIGRAVVEIQSRQQPALQQNQKAASPSRAEVPGVEPDAAAMGDIYFRDGLTYLRLGDFNAANDVLTRAVTYDPSRGIILANLAYTRFKLDPTSREMVDETARLLTQAMSMEPDNPEVFVICARFAINTQNHAMSRRAIDRLEALKPDHPRLERLRRRARH